MVLPKNRMPNGNSSRNPDPDLVSMERIKLYKKTSRKRRQETAKRVDAERAKRSAEEQLDVLDTRLGEGVGAKKERARLEEALIAEAEKTSSTGHSTGGPDGKEGAKTGPRV